MPRSEAALARRAAKRGRTLEEERKVDKERERGYKGKSWDPSLTSRKRKPGKESEQGVQGEQGKQGGSGEQGGSQGPFKKHKPSTDAAPTTTEEEEPRETWVCKNCAFENWASRFKCKECAGKRYSKQDKKEKDKKWVDPAVAGSWKAPASSEKIQENAALRAAYERCPEAMDEEDRKRGKLLYERTLRKRKKKLARRQVHADRLSGKLPQGKASRKPKRK